MQTACALGIADRVDVIDIGSLGLLTRHSAGMITINSTSGLSAIFHGVPLLVIGDALYANDKLAVCGNGQPNFDAFWTCGHRVSAAIRRSEEHTSELQSLMRNSYAVFCLKKK